MSKTNVIEFVLTLGDGGAETLVKDYAILMDKERFDVTVVVLHALEDSANLQRLREYGISVVALSAEGDVLKKIWRSLFRPTNVELLPDTVEEQMVAEERTGLRKIVSKLRNLFFGLKLLKIVHQKKADVIHAHLDVLEILEAVGCKLKNVRLFHTCHNPPEVIYAGEEKKAAASLVRKNGMRIIALHEQMAQELNALFSVDNTEVIRNGIDIQRFVNSGVQKKDKREELGIPLEAYVVGHVGRFAEQKNHMFLAEVFREVAARCPDAYLLMVGAGDSFKVEKMLRQYGLHDRYKILQHRKDIHEILRAMDVFVFPSLFEGFGIALLEAQASGLRCVASDVCPEEVFRTEICMALPLEDPSIWAEKILDVSWKLENSRNIWDYDMNREIRRLEKLYLGQLDE